MIALRLAPIATLAFPTAGAAQDADLDEISFVRGDPDAPVVVVEYADFACSACAEFARDTWPTIEREYVETGIVRWHMVAFELGFRNSEEGAKAGQCAGALGAFWSMHDLLFSRRGDWADERRPKDVLVEIAVTAGLDEEAFVECYDDDPGRDRTRSANRAARDLGVRGTPTFLINGFQVQGALPIEVFSGLIESARGGNEPG